ncbi:hypothetical protein C8Q72DRAFT_889277 [Fomitopsis betulina]|nr:hypothetical protein C8Q72DRAFT_889277 [Fomitopsis betulina]
MFPSDSNIEPSTDDSLPSLLLILNGPTTTSSAIERARWDLGLKFLLPDVSSGEQTRLALLVLTSESTPTSPSGKFAELGISESSSNTQRKVVKHDGGIDIFTTLAASFDSTTRAASEGQIAQKNITFPKDPQLYTTCLGWDQILTRPIGLRKAREKVASRFNVLVDTGSNTR